MWSNPSSAEVFNSGTIGLLMTSVSVTVSVTLNPACVENPIGYGVRRDGRLSSSWAYRDMKASERKGKWKYAISFVHR